MSLQKSPSTLQNIFYKSTPSSHYSSFLYAAVCWRWFIDKGTLKFWLRCRTTKIQISRPALRPEINFYIELEQFCCLISATSTCSWINKPANYITPEVLQTWKIISKREHEYLWTYLYWATGPRVGGGRLKTCFFDDLFLFGELKYLSILFRKVQKYSELSSYQGPSKHMLTKTWGKGITVLTSGIE